MSATIESDWEHPVKKKKLKKPSTKESCLFHCRKECDFDEIVEFSETWKVSL